MMVHVALPASGSAWVASDRPELTSLLGRVGRVQTVTLTAERRDALRRSVGDGFVDDTTTLADFCPDPLVLALDSGLPRVILLDGAVDGGSEWEQLTPMNPGSLRAVSRIAEVVERVSSTGRRMIRTCYETELRDARGFRVGIARGFSLDVEVAAS